MPSRLRRLGHDEEVSVVDHLDELRQRIIVSLVTLGAAAAFTFWQHARIIELLNRQLPSSVSQPTTLDVGEPFRIALTVSVWSALLIALPVLFYQLYAFVVPAFGDDYQRSLWPLLVVVPALFIAGAVFAYLVVVPAAVGFLVSFDSDLYNNQVRAGSYYPFVVQLMLALGIVFELPAATLLLTRLGVVSSRLLRRNRRYAIVVCAVVAAALPGTDPVSMLVELLPLLLLFEISIVVARVAERRSASVGDVLGDV